VGPLLASSETEKTTPLPLKCNNSFVFSLGNTVKAQASRYQRLLVLQCTKCNGPEAELAPMVGHCLSLLRCRCRLLWDCCLGVPSVSVKQKRGCSGGVLEDKWKKPIFNLPRRKRDRHKRRPSLTKACNADANAVQFCCRRGPNGQQDYRVIGKTLTSPQNFFLYLPLRCALFLLMFVKCPNS
jgi:hypothetical protein